MSDALKQELLDFVLTHRDAGTLTGKLIKKVRKQALKAMLDTAIGTPGHPDCVVDLESIWIGAGCPKGKEPAAWLNRHYGSLN